MSRAPSRPRILLATAIAAATSVGVVVAGVAGAAGSAGSLAVAAPAAHSGAHPTPAVVGHMFAATLSTPPSTSDCLAMYNIRCYNPTQYARAYQLPALFRSGSTGRGRTIAIVDSYGSPTIRHDLKVFDKTFGLSDPKLEIIQPAGAVPPYDNSPTRQGWADETSLDVEYAHVFAPEAKILLVETPVAETEGTTGFPEIVKAETYVVDHHLADVISQSFGATEETFPSKQSLYALRTAFFDAAAKGVTVLAASGDAGATDAESDGSTLYPMRVNSWPSSDPLVTSIGGTMLKLDNQGRRLAPDAVWNDGYGAGGGGVSADFNRPEFQNGVRNIVGAHRGTPDISMSAAVNGAAILYYSFDPAHVGYHLVGGTSEATPIFAGIVADAAQRARHHLGQINFALYGIQARGEYGIYDVTAGNNSFAGVRGYYARPGYDLASGLGTIVAPAFVRDLAAAAG